MGRSNRSRTGWSISGRETFIATAYSRPTLHSSKFASQPSAPCILRLHF
jgi:hypothetical protein